MSATTTDWPPIYKTPAMLEVEQAHDGRDIRDIILDAMRQERRDSDAAFLIGTYKSTLSHWIPKLGIYEHAAEIRRNRR